MIFFEKGYDWCYIGGEKIINYGYIYLYFARNGQIF